MINMIQGDCMDLMREKPDNYYDLAIVDPPYGINRGGQGETFTKNPKHKRKEHKQKEWDNKRPNGEYFAELQRISKNQIIWGANYFTEFLPPSMGWVFWDKGQDLTMSDGELAFTSFEKALRRIIINRVEIMKDGAIHPTQKPVKLYEWLLMNYATCKTCGNEGGYYEDVAGDGGSRMWQFCDDCTTHEKPVKILDTHGGSGSICLACHNLGFDLDWIELDQDYYEAAKKRYERHKRQLRMF